MGQQFKTSKLLSAATYFCSAMLILVFATTTSAQISTVSFHNPSESDADSTVLQINKLVE
jgi:hypothetical protein